MQLGTRWSVGEEPPAALPEPFVRAVLRVEAELEADGVDAVGWRWTLTWLEGRPVVELDDGTRIVAAPEGATILPPADED